MGLIKRVIDNETVYSPEFEYFHDKHNYVLLGFKDSLSVVISSKMNPQVNPPKKTVKVETNGSTGEKFIMLNGKKIKILAESELPKNSQLVKIGTLPCPKMIPLGKKQLQFSNINLTNGDKTIKTVITSKTASMGGKFIKIALSSAEQHIKATTDDKRQVSDIENIEMVKSGNSRGKPPMENSNSILNIRGVDHQSTALDLTKNNAKKDMCVQATMILDNKEVQTNLSMSNDSDLDTNLRNIFDCEYLEQILRTDDFCNVDDSNKTYTNLENSSSTPELNKSSAENFHRELRTALQVDDRGNFPIHVGVLVNDVKLVRRSCFILKILKQNVDIPNNNELTPLQLAILNNSDLAIVHILLSNGANIQVIDGEGNNLIHLAVEHGRREALRLLLDCANQQKIDLNQRNHEGLTALMVCCLNRNHDCAELLLEADADPNVKDQISGRTALFHAAEVHDIDMVEMLLQFDACTKIKNFFGTSPHDAMYEIEDLPEQIRFMILGRHKRKAPTDIIKNKSKSKYSKMANGIQQPAPLRTYARLEKI